MLPNWVISCHRVVSRVSRVSDDWRAFGSPRDFAAEGKKALTGRDHTRLRKARVDMVLLRHGATDTSRKFKQKASSTSRALPAGGEGVLAL